MSIKQKFVRLCRSDWFVAAALLIVFLLTNGYIYSWDDQHVEIPLLKRLIDPSLYPGDYYVDSLAKNFPSYFFHILAKFITTDQVPAAYLILYLLSRYFLFFWIYKLWKTISQDRFSAFMCGLMVILIGRVEEFLYRTFSHQEFALAIVVAGIYYFYKDRFILAAALLGIASNFHAIYSLFPMIYLCVYLCFYEKKNNWEKLSKAILSFSLCAIPVVWRIGEKFHNTALPADSPLLANWFDLYKIACSQNFIFLDIPLDKIFSSMKNFLGATSKLFYLFGLYTLNTRFNPPFIKDKKAQSVALTTIVLLAISFIFTYIWPSRFILDLNLVRNTQFLLFFLVGYTTLLLLNKTEQKNIKMGIIIGLIFTLLRYADIISFFAVLFLYGLLILTEERPQPKFKPYLFGSLLLIALITAYDLVFGLYSLSSKIIMAVVVLSLLALWFAESRDLTFLRALSYRRKLPMILPLVIIFFSFCFFHVRYLNIVKTGSGLWQLQRNWEDMQRYVKQHTPQNAIILAPNDTEMGGFRIFSERSIVVCYRDCGIIGFDFKAAREWQTRLKDVDAFQVYIRKPLESALYNALYKYKVNYIVFMKYAAPHKNVPVLEEMYENEVFALYRVRGNPVQP